MKILAIDTSTEACSVALYVDSATTTRYQIAPNQHTKLILPMIDEILSDSSLSLSQLDALAFTNGPGTFTGVRTATAVIHGLALSADIPIIAVSTLAVLAQGAISESRQIACAIDARMGQIYWALYKADEKNLMRLLGKESVCAPDAIELVTQQDRWFGVGSGWNSYAPIFQKKMGHSLASFRLGDYPTAIDICHLAAVAYECGQMTLDCTQAMPIYLRNNVTS